MDKVVYLLVTAIAMPITKRTSPRGAGQKSTESEQTGKIIAANNTGDDTTDEREDSNPFGFSLTMWFVFIGGSIVAVLLLLICVGWFCVHVGKKFCTSKKGTSYKAQGKFQSSFSGGDNVVYGETPSMSFRNKRRASSFDDEDYIIPNEVEVTNYDSSDENSD